MGWGGGSQRQRQVFADVARIYDVASTYDVASAYDGNSTFDVAIIYYVANTF